MNEKAIYLNIEFKEVQNVAVYLVIDFGEDHFKHLCFYDHVKVSRNSKSCSKDSDQKMI